MPTRTCPATKRAVPDGAAQGGVEEAAAKPQQRPPTKASAGPMPPRCAIWSRGCSNSKWRAFPTAWSRFAQGPGSHRRGQPPLLRRAGGNRSRRTAQIKETMSGSAWER